MMSNTIITTKMAEQWSAALESRSVFIDRAFLVDKDEAAHAVSYVKGPVQNQEHCIYCRTELRATDRVCISCSAPKIKGSIR